MQINQTQIHDTYAEAFSMRYTRLIVTAADDYWLDAAMNAFTGYGTSVIGCDAEVGVECRIDGAETPDGRPGTVVLAFGFDSESLAKAIVNRCGQCLMTCPTTAVFNGLKSDEQFDLGNKLRFFGDGYQKSKSIGDRRFWRVPVMDGEFVIEDTVGLAKGVAGGNFLILADDQQSGLTAARVSVEAISTLPGVITPFPGGVVRSGSKVGSKYNGMVASTSHAFCPTLRGRVESKLDDSVNCVYEIVIDGTDFDVVERATQLGISAAAIDGISAISAGNYGGNLGKHKFFLHELLKKMDNESDVPPSKN